MHVHLVPVCETVLEIKVRSMEKVGHILTNKLTLVVMGHYFLLSKTTFYACRRSASRRHFKGQIYDRSCFYLLMFNFLAIEFRVLSRVQSFTLLINAVAMRWISI